MTDTAYHQAAAQLENIEALMFALEVDYYRLQELTDAAAEISGLPDDDREELEELQALANGCKNDDDALTAIQEAPLCVEVRSGWRMQGEELTPEEFSITLCTGGPAVRILGELDHHGEPGRAWLEYQDWGTSWTHFVGGGDVLVRFAAQFIAA